MAVSRTELQEWRENPVTKELVKDINKIVEELASSLISKKDFDPHRDQYTKGFIGGVISTYEWEPEITDET